MSLKNIIKFIINEKGESISYYIDKRKIGLISTIYFLKQEICSIGKRKEGEIYSSKEERNNYILPPSYIR